MAILRNEKTLRYFEKRRKLYVASMNSSIEAVAV